MKLPEASCTASIVIPDLPAPDSDRGPGIRFFFFPDFRSPIGVGDKLRGNDKQKVSFGSGSQYVTQPDLWPFLTEIYSC